MFGSLHAEQQAFLSNPARFKCALAGRRGGKSYVVAYWLLQGWRYRPGQVSLFVARSIGHARDILWDLLKALNRRWEWGAQAHEGRLEMTFPNGYQIRLRGAQNLSQVERIRGPSYWRVALDEVHLYPDRLLRFMFTSIIRPALADHLGEMIMTGTPGYDLQGMWFERTLDPEQFPDKAGDPKKVQWPTHRWTILDNPHIPDAEQELEDVLSENNWSPTNPEFLREWRGLWVEDVGALVYPYRSPVNVFNANDYPEGYWKPGTGVKSVIGVDVGWEDGCGFAVSQKRADAPKIVVPKAYSEVHLTDHQIAQHIKVLMREYQTQNVYIDSSGNKITAMTMRNYGIPAEPCIKGEKRPRIEYMRGLLLDGNLQIDPENAADLVGEMQTLPWEMKKMNEKGTNVMRKVGHREGWIDECCDATLASVMMHSQRWVKPKPKKDDIRARERLAAMRKGAASRHGKRSKSNRTVPMR